MKVIFSEQDREMERLRKRMDRFDAIVHEYLRSSHRTVEELAEKAGCDPSSLWRYRRKVEYFKKAPLALGLSKEDLAQITGLDVKLIGYYESGENVARYVGMDIKRALYEQFKDMDSVNHYKKRILELALEINMQDDTDFMTQELGHMMVELGKLQMEIFNQR